MTPQPVVEFRDVTCAYGSHVVVDRVNLSLHRGEALILVGRSGAGKSSLLKLVNGILLPARGSVLVDGRDTREWDPFVLRRSTGYVLQHIGLLPHLSVQDNVSLVLRLLGWDATTREARAAELLEMVGLPPSTFAARWPHELSGGQQQRVGVARALAANPPVLLMDEPFGALDAITRGELQTLVRDIQRTFSQTMLMVTHDIAEASAMGTQIGVLDAGSLIAWDRPDAIWRSADPRVRRLLDAVPAVPVRG